MGFSSLPLATIRAGEDVRVSAVCGCKRRAQRLRELGILEGQTIRVVLANDPLICQIGDCRFGLSRRLARSVMVTPALASRVA